MAEGLLPHENVDSPVNDYKGQVAVYRQYAADGTLLYVGVSANPLRRMSEHNSKSGRKVARIEIDWFDSRVEALAAEREAIKTEAPRDNKAGLSLHTGKCAQSTVPNVAAYIATRGHVTVKELAATFGVSRPFLYGLLDGTRCPSPKVALRIAKVTDNAIPVSTWPNMRAMLEALA